MIRKVRDTVVIDGFTGNDGQDSNWSIVFKPKVGDDTVCFVGLYWGDKQEPTHEAVVSTPELVKFAQDVL